MTHASAPTMSAVRKTMSTQRISSFGGARSSSGVSLSMFSRRDIGEYDQKCSDRDKYISKIKNRKIF